MALARLLTSSAIITIAVSLIIAIHFCLPYFNFSISWIRGAIGAIRYEICWSASQKSGESRPSRKVWHHGSSISSLGGGRRAAAGCSCGAMSHS